MSKQKTEVKTRMGWIHLSKKMKKKKVKVKVKKKRMRKVVVMTTTMIRGFSRPWPKVRLSPRRMQAVL